MKYTIEELREDWLDRNTGSYVPAISSTSASKGRHSYPPLLRGSKLKLLSRAYAIGNSVIRNLCKKRIKLRLTEETSKTDGMCISVSTDYFDSLSVSSAEKTSILVGLTAHECAHVLYTDFNLLNTHFKGKKEDFETYLESRIQNILEDEYIETFLIGDYEIYQEPLEICKYYYFDVRYKAALEEATSEDALASIPDNIKEQYKSLSQLMGLLLCKVRYPVYQDDYALEEHQEILGEIRSIITPYPSSTRAVIECSEQILALLKKHFADTFEYIKQRNAHYEKMVEALLNLLRVFAASVSSSAAGDESSSSIALSTHVNTDVEAELLGEYKRREDCFIYNVDNINKKFLGDDDEETTYKDLYRDVKSIVTPLSRSFRFLDVKYTYSIKSTKSGKLDTSKLVDVICGSENVYEQVGQVVTSEVAVILLIDQSGSMFGNPLHTAKKAAVALIEALRGIRSIELYVYGHTQIDNPDPTSFQVIKYLDKTTKDYTSVARAKAMGGNKDGYAIKAVAEIVREQTDRNGVMFVLSDGNPCATGYTGDLGVEDTRKRVREAAKIGFTPIQIAINHFVEPDKMFDHFVYLEDLSRLPKDLTKFVRSTLGKIQKRNSF